MLNLKSLVALIVAIEIPTGLALVFWPSIFTRLLLGSEMSGAGNALGPLAGFGILALVLACWPQRSDAAPPAPVVRALLAFSFLCALYLAFLGVSRSGAGPLLWPAAILHAVLGLLLLWQWLSRRGSQT